MLIGKLELRREISWLESSLRNSDVPFWCNCLFFSLTCMINWWLCFQIVSSIDRGSTSPVSWLRFSDMKRSTWVLSEFSQVFSFQIETWGFSFWRENVSAKDRTSTQFSRSRADSKYWEQSWTTHLIWKNKVIKFYRITITSGSELLCLLYPGRREY